MSTYTGRERFALAALESLYRIANAHPHLEAVGEYNGAVQMFAALTGQAPGRVKETVLQAYLDNNRALGVTVEPRI